MTYMIDPDKDLLIFREREIAKDKGKEKKQAEEVKGPAKNEAIPEDEADKRIEQEKKELESKAAALEEERLKVEQEKEEMKKTLQEREAEETNLSAKMTEEEKKIDEERREKEEELKAESETIEEEKKELEEQRKQLEEMRRVRDNQGQELPAREVPVVNEKGREVNKVPSDENYNGPEWQYDGIEEGIYNQVDEALKMDGNVKAGSKKKDKKKSEDESRKLAEGLTCVWHPWRKAYAVCAICHRPFCFEDLVEYGGKYYCLEDIDKVKMKNAPESRSQYFNAIAGIMFILPFVLLFYLNINSFINAVGIAQSVGFFSFITAEYMPYIMQIAYIVLAVISFAEGILAFVGSRKALPIGVGIGAVLIVLFVYEYIESLSAYYLGIIFIYIAAIAFVIYARFRYDIEVAVSKQITESEMPADWPAAVRF